MALRRFVLPDLGEGLTEADILSWLVKEGDEVTLNQPIVEVETAKAAVEVPSPWAGTVQELHAPQGQTVAVGAPLITIDTVDGRRRGRRGAGAPAAGERESMLVGYGPRPAQTGRRPRIAAGRRGIGSARLERAGRRHRAGQAAGAQAGPRSRRRPAHGARHRAGRKHHARGRRRRQLAPSAPAQTPANAGVSPVSSPAPGERIALHGVRKAMAEAMTRSAFTAPQASVTLTVDATETDGPARRSRGTSGVRRGAALPAGAGRAGGVRRGSPRSADQLEPRRGRGRDRPSRAAEPGLRGRDPARADRAEHQGRREPRRCRSSPPR